MDFLHVNTARGGNGYPAYPYCRWWKGEYILYVHGGNGCTLPVHTAGGGKGYTLYGVVGSVVEPEPEP